MIKNLFFFIDKNYIFQFIILSLTLYEFALFWGFWYFQNILKSKLSIFNISKYFFIFIYIVLVFFCFLLYNTESSSNSISYFYNYNLDSEITFTSIFLYTILYTFNLLYFIVLSKLNLLKKSKTQFLICFLISIFFLTNFILLLTKNLLYLYICFEFQTFVTVILSLTYRTKKEAIQSSFIYFIIFSIISIIFLFLIILIFYNYNSVNLNFISLIVDTIKNNKIININQIHNLIFFLISIIFFSKLAIFPYHFWIKSFSQGIPFIILGFININKFTIIIIFYKLIIIFFPITHTAFFHAFYGIISFLTVLIGSYFTLYETNLKSFFALSSIVHMGFLIGLLILVVNHTDMNRYAIFYLIHYSFVMMIIWSLLTYFSEKNITNDITINHLKYLFIKNNKIFAIIFTIVVLSFSGIPPFIGFFFKFFTFCGITEISKIFPFVLLIHSVVPSFYYLRLLYFIFFIPLDKKDLKRFNILETDKIQSEKSLFEIYLKNNFYTNLFIFFMLIFSIFPFFTFFFSLLTTLIIF